MNNRQIHRNLDTSFVNLSALVKYLRRRQFIGCVNIQLNGYQAEIVLTADSRLVVREHDQISGRVSEGEEAFQRLLIRAREPGGTINVFQKTETKEKKAAGTVTQKPIQKPVSKSEDVVQVIPVKLMETPVPKPIDVPFNPPKPPASVKTAVAVNGNGNGNGKTNGTAHYQIEQTESPVPIPTPKTNDTDNKKPSLPDFPFKLTNKVERKAQETRSLSKNDWQNLLKLSVELLGVVDRSLAVHGLDFTAAFRKARTEIAEDYPFMNPAAKIFDYENGRITMSKQINETIYISSIVVSLKRILSKLGENPKFGIAHRDTSQVLISLASKRKKYYDRFGLTVPIKRMLGI